MKNEPAVKRRFEKKVEMVKKAMEKNIRFLSQERLEIERKETDVLKAMKREGREIEPKE